jgi:hypothetical protein
MVHRPAGLLPALVAWVALPAEVVRVPPCFGTKRLTSGHPTLPVLDLIPKVLHVRRANHNWRAGGRAGMGFK